ncbi:hypothetical protein [Maridesulfovibrio bastinii]|nr:hypothetical protein [Maridesulfovibrio bastinii]
MKARTAIVEARPRKNQKKLIRLSSVKSNNSSETFSLSEKVLFEQG